VDGYPCNAVYAAMIEHLDNSVGRVMGKLEELGLSDNTVVVFFSDNGGLIRRFDGRPILADSKMSVYEGDTLQFVVSSNAPLRSEKGTVYEGGIRVPLIVRWPGKTAPGSATNAPVSSIDFFPTVVEMGGGVLPDTQVVDGRSLTPVLAGGSYDPDRALFWHYPVYHHSVPASAVRKGDWKLIQFLDEGRLELYNLKQDVGETNNLADALPEKAAELLGLLEGWRQEVRAEMPEPNPDFNPDRRWEWGHHPGIRATLNGEVIP
jgi:arylsulfatase A